MSVDEIDDLAGLDRIKANWDAVYAADPVAHIFSSWAWLRGYLPFSRRPWRVLAYRPSASSDYTAFMSLSAQPGRLTVSPKLKLGACPFSDYSGIVVMPGAEDDAIAALAHHIQEELEWDLFEMDDLLDSRSTRLLSHFDAYDVEIAPQHPCPYIDLPPSWDEYLATSLSHSARKKIRRRTAQVEGLPDFNIIEAKPENIHEQMEVLLSLWTARWGVSMVRIYRALFERCLDEDHLWLHVFRSGKEPIAALAGFVDPPKKTFYSFMSGYNDAYSHLSPGRVMDAHSIRYAIENGFITYDFLRGNNDYKFSLGCSNRHTTGVRIERRGWPARMRRRASHWISPRQRGDGAAI